VSGPTSDAGGRQDGRDLAALGALLPGLALAPDVPQLYDLEHRERIARGLRGDQRQASSALINLRPRPCNTLIVWCRASREQWSPGAGFWSALLEQPAHVITLEDRQGLFYARGVAAFGDRLSDTAQELRALRDALGVTTVLTCGNSAGGAGALLMGAELSADRTLLFSPITTVDLGFHGAGQLDTDDSPRVLKRMQRLERELAADEFFDTATLLREGRGPRRVRSHYPSAVHWDRVWSEHLQGLPGVELVPHAHATRHSLIDLQIEGENIVAREIREFLMRGD